MADEVVDTAGTEEEKLDVLGMSDEDFANTPIPEVSNEPADTAVADTTNTDAPDAVANTEESSNEDDAIDASATGNKDESTVADDTTTDVSTDAGKGTDTPAELDFKAEYTKLTAPFKANGVDVQVNSTEEILSLMQMGANYHKKMAALKPSMKIMKLLERHDMLDEGKLGYLIDLHSKNPAAITKLLKDSGMDPLAIDTDAVSTYVPNTPRISDTEMDLETVLEDIKGSQSYGRTLKVVSETWDDASRNTIAASPNIIAIINEQITNGIFDKVSSEVDRARRFGKLQGVSDFEAYKQMGDLMHSQGKLVQPASTPASVNANPDNAQKKEADEKRKAAKKAAGITTGKPVAATKPVSNLLALSDDEFNKLPTSAYTKVN